MLEFAYAPLVTVTEIKEQSNIDDYMQNLLYKMVDDRLLYEIELYNRTLKQQAIVNRESTCEYIGIGQYDKGHYYLTKGIWYL